MANDVWSRLKNAVGAIKGEASTDNAVATVGGRPSRDVSDLIQGGDPLVANSASDDQMSADTSSDPGAISTAPTSPPLPSHSVNVNVPDTVGELIKQGGLQWQAAAADPQANLSRVQPTDPNTNQVIDNSWIGGASSPISANAVSPGRRFGNWFDSFRQQIVPQANTPTIADRRGASTSATPTVAAGQTSSLSDKIKLGGRVWTADNQMSNALVAPITDAASITPSSNTTTLDTSDDTNSGVASSRQATALSTDSYSILARHSATNSDQPLTRSQRLRQTELDASPEAANETATPVSRQSDEITNAVPKISETARVQTPSSVSLQRRQDLDGEPIYELHRPESVERVPISPPVPESTASLPTKSTQNLGSANAHQRIQPKPETSTVSSPETKFIQSSENVPVNQDLRADEKSNVTESAAPPPLNDHRSPITQVQPSRQYLVTETLPTDEQTPAVASVSGSVGSGTFGTAPLEPIREETSTTTVGVPTSNETTSTNSPRTGETISNNVPSDNDWELSDTSQTNDISATVPTAKTVFTSEPTSPAPESEVITSTSPATDEAALVYTETIPTTEPTFESELPPPSFPAPVVGRGDEITTNSTTTVSETATLANETIAPTSETPAVTGEPASTTEVFSATAVSPQSGVEMDTNGEIGTGAVSETRAPVLQSSDTEILPTPTNAQSDAEALNATTASPTVETKVEQTAENIPIDKDLYHEQFPVGESAQAAAATDNDWQQSSSSTPGDSQLTASPLPHTERMGLAAGGLSLAPAPNDQVPTQTASVPEDRSRAGEIGVPHGVQDLRDKVQAEEAGATALPETAGETAATLSSATTEPTARLDGAEPVPAPVSSQSQVTPETVADTTSPSETNFEQTTENIPIDQDFIEEQISRGEESSVASQAHEYFEQPTPSAATDTQPAPPSQFSAANTVTVGFPTPSGETTPETTLPVPEAQSRASEIGVPHDVQDLRDYVRLRDGIDAATAAASGEAAIISPSPELPINQSTEGELIFSPSNSAPVSAMAVEMSGTTPDQTKFEQVSENIPINQYLQAGENLGDFSAQLAHDGGYPVSTPASGQQIYPEVPDVSGLPGGALLGSLGVGLGTGLAGDLPAPTTPPSIDIPTLELEPSLTPSAEQVPTMSEPPLELPAMDGVSLPEAAIDTGFGAANPADFAAKAALAAEPATTGDAASPVPAITPAAEAVSSEPTIADISATMTPAGGVNVGRVHRLEPSPSQQFGQRHQDLGRNPDAPSVVNASVHTPGVSSAAPSNVLGKGLSRLLGRGGDKARGVADTLARKALQAGLQGLRSLARKALKLLRFIASILSFLTTNPVGWGIIIIVILLILLPRLFSGGFQSGMDPIHVAYGGPGAQLVGQQQASDECLTITKIANPKSISDINARAPDQRVVDYTFTITPKEGMTVVLDGTCEDTVSISCKDKDNCPTPDPADLSSAVCGLLQQKAGEGGRFSQTISFKLKDTVEYPQGYPLPDGDNYRLRNKWSIKAHCVGQDEDGNPKETPSKTYDASDSTCVGECGSDLCWPYEPHYVSSWPHGTDSNKYKKVDVSNRSKTPTTIHAPITGTYTYRYTEPYCCCGGITTNCKKVDEKRTPCSSLVKNSPDGKYAMCDAGCYVMFTYNGITFRLMHMERQFCDFKARVANEKEHNCRMSGSNMQCDFTQGEPIGITDTTGANTALHAHFDCLGGKNACDNILQVFFPNTYASYKRGDPISNSSPGGPNCPW